LEHSISREEIDTGTAKKKGHYYRGFLLHLHPRKVSAETLRFFLSFGLGGMSATLLLLLFITGVLQILSYDSDATGAYNSINIMYENASLSGWTRNIHYWSGNLLVIIALLHCCRVFLTGAIAGGRRNMNWFIGLLLLGLVLFSNFTGYLLPWDQLAFWAVTIFTSMLGYIPIIGESVVHLLRGGPEIGPTTLANFYAIHTGILPFCFVVVVFYHFWLVRKSGGLVRREGGQKTAPQFVSAVPDLIVREAAVGFILIALVLLFAAVVDAPLAEMANPAMSPNPAKAAWYFLGFQELLMHLHPIYAILVLPSLLFLCILLLPFWREASLPPGLWFGGRRGRRLALWSCLTGSVTTFAAVLFDEAVKTAGTATATDSITRGLLPTIVIFIIYASGYFILTAALRFTKAQTVMAGFIVTLTSVCCLTFIAIWLRGPGMKLMLPF
jgi:quinol-cytochrome oxidoreductase complex cytochrome b subunit